MTAPHWCEAANAWSYDTNLVSDLHPTSTMVEEGDRLARAGTQVSRAVEREVGEDREKQRRTASIPPIFW